VGDIVHPLDVDAEVDLLQLQLQWSIQQFLWQNIS
jgi:hypothetical protein